MWGRPSKTSSLSEFELATPEGTARRAGDRVAGILRGVAVLVDDAGVGIERCAGVDLQIAVERNPDVGNRLDRDRNRDIPDPEPEVGQLDTLEVLLAAGSIRDEQVDSGRAGESEDDACVLQRSTRYVGRSIQARRRAQREADARRRGQRRTALSKDPGGETEAEGGPLVRNPSQRPRVRRCVVDGP